MRRGIHTNQHALSGGLMADRVLRDQCEHGRYESHGEFTSQIVRNDKDELTTESETTWCPGGREVSIDAICDEIWELGQGSWPWRDAPTPVLDAAPGGRSDG